MSVSPLAALVDQPVVVTVQGLPAGARATLTARARDTDGITWSATAQFEATSAGEVSLDQPSLGGSYTGGNPMGLFTLLAPPPGSAPDWFLYPEAGYDVELEASAGGRVTATATVKRQGPTAAGVTEMELAPNQGRDLREPVPAQAHHGPRLSEPGPGLFQGAGPAQTLTNIPLEYFTSAVRVLRAQPGVDPDHVLVAGVSRGGEAALLLGAHFPHWSTTSSPGSPARW